MVALSFFGDIIEVNSDTKILREREREREGEKPIPRDVEASFRNERVH
jgi:hypothetical protein